MLTGQRFAVVLCANGTQTSLIYTALSLTAFRIRIDDQEGVGSLNAKCVRVHVTLTFTIHT